MIVKKRIKIIIFALLVVLIISGILIVLCEDSYDAEPPMVVEYSAEEHVEQPALEFTDGASEKPDEEKAGEQEPDIEETDEEPKDEPTEVGIITGDVLINGIPASRLLLEPFETVLGDPVRVRDNFVFYGFNIGSRQLYGIFSKHFQ